MINIHTWKDKIIMLNKKYPVYGTNDRVIGYTAVGDKAVITYQDENMDYFETILISGKYTGVNTLALDKKDIESSTLVIDKAFSYQQYFFNNKEIKTYYENDYDDVEIDCFDALKDILDNSDSEYLKYNNNKIIIETELSDSQIETLNNKNINISEPFAANVTLDYGNEVVYCAGKVQSSYKAEKNQGKKKPERNQEYERE
jgi:hypothetical protein